MYLSKCIIERSRASASFRAKSGDIDFVSHDDDIDDETESLWWWNLLDVVLSVIICLFTSLPQKKKTLDDSSPLLLFLSLFSPTLSSERRSAKTWARCFALKNADKMRHFFPFTRDDDCVTRCLFSSEAECRRWRLLLWHLKERGWLRRARESPRAEFVFLCCLLCLLKHNRKCFFRFRVGEVPSGETRDV